MDRSGSIGELSATFTGDRVLKIAIMIVVVILAAALFMTAYAGMPNNFTGTDHDWFLISIGRMMAFLMG